MCRPTDRCGECDRCTRERTRDVADEVARYLKEEMTS